MPQVVMRDAICADFLCRPIKRLLTFADQEYLCVQWLAETFAAHSLKQRARIGNQRNTAQLPIFRARLSVATHDDFARVKVHVSPSDLARLTNATTCERQACCEVGAVD